MVAVPALITILLTTPFFAPSVVAISDSHLSGAVRPASLARRSRGPPSRGAAPSGPKRMPLSPAQKAKLQKGGMGTWIVGNELVCLGGAMAGAAANPAAQEASRVIQSFCDARGSLEGAGKKAIGKGGKRKRAVVAERWDGW